MTTPTSVNVYGVGVGTAPTAMTGIVPFVATFSPAPTNTVGPNGAFKIGQVWINSATNQVFVLTSISSVGGVVAATWTSNLSGVVDTITGMNGVTVAPPVGDVVVSGVNATTGSVGVASFNPADFTVSGGGQVSLIGGPSIATITGNSGGPESPSAGNFNILGTGSITVAGSASTETVQLTGLTNHSLLVGAGTATITNLGVASNGQLPIGSSGADPVLATLTAGTGISITNGAGSITVAATGTPITTIDGDSGFVSGSTVTLTASGFGGTAKVDANVGHTILTMNASDGNLNVGYGQGALGVASGSLNVAVGEEAMNTGTGSNNTAVGYVALGSGNGSDNTCIGFRAGSSFSGTETSNIIIGADVSDVGHAGDNNLIRIGSPAQILKCFIAGIDGVNVGSTAQVVTESGNQLGTSVITAGSGISVTPGANTITIAVSGSSVGQTITGDSGGALSPTAGNWNIVGLSGIKTNGSGSTLTIQGPPFSQVGVSGTSSLNTGEFVNAAVTRTLPVSAGLANGDLFTYVCTTAGALVIQAVGAQKIRIGSSISSAAGTMTSNAIGDSVTLRFNATDGFFYAVSVIGTWTAA